MEYFLQFRGLKGSIRWFAVPRYEAAKIAGLSANIPRQSRGFSEGAAQSGWLGSLTRPPCVLASPRINFRISIPKFVVTPAAPRERTDHIEIVPSPPIIMKLLP